MAQWAFMSKFCLQQFFQRHRQWNSFLCWTQKDNSMPTQMWDVTYKYTSLNLQLFKYLHKLSPCHALFWFLTQLILFVIDSVSFIHSIMVLKLLPRQCHQAEPFHYLSSMIPVNVAVSKPSCLFSLPCHYKFTWSVLHSKIGILVSG